MDQRLITLTQGDCRRGVNTYPFNVIDLSIFPALPAGFPIPLSTATLASPTSLAPQSGLSGVPLPLSASEIFRMTSSADELSVRKDNGPDAVDTEPLKQDFFADENGDSVKRYSFSGLTWSAIASPQKDPLKVRNNPNDPASRPSDVTGYRMSYLIHQDRSYIVGDDLAKMVYAPVKRINFENGKPGAPAANNPTFLNGGYVKSVTRIVMNEFSEAQAELFDEAFVKNDWVMVINRRPEVPYRFPPNTPSIWCSQLFGGPYYRDGNFTATDESILADEEGFNLQIGFFRIINAQSGYDDIAANRRDASLTVTGGEFDFYYSDIPGTETYVVHLKNVLNVFESSFNLN